MALSPLFSLHLALVGIFFPTISAFPQTQSKPNCPYKCGNVDIPFPFGVGDACSLNSNFNITCDNSAQPPKTYLRTSDFEVVQIMVEGQVSVLTEAARHCYNKTSGNITTDQLGFSLAEFSVSKSRNKFTVIGCDSYGYLEGQRNNGKRYKAGCMSVCDYREYVDDGHCSGSGCCQIEITDGINFADVSAYSFKNHKNVSDFSPCTYAFIVDQTKFKFSSRYLRNISKDEKLPVVLDWSVEKTKNDTEVCIMANASVEYLNSNGSEFRCKCNPGYEGNPYLNCTDIDECKEKSMNNCSHHCINKHGNYTCSCRNWYKVNERNKQECVLQTFSIILITISVAAAIIVALMGSSWTYLVFKHRRIMKQRERLFRENGGFTLQQKLSGRQGSSSSTSSFKIYTAIELDKATNHYDKALIIGKGGFGIVYKGTLSDKSQVAIKKCTTPQHFQVEQFVNEVLVLSQINHRNVVKLLGCCLELETPLLVYEFIANGTLFDHIHLKPTSTFPWEIRLQVAVDTAIALNYLNFEAAVPIFHRDVKTSNILLGPNYTAKVSDFGASRFVPLDETQVSTLVQGTMGYLDPEYMRTSQLTDKSDVYSFGVVVVELLTGMKPLSFDRPEPQRSLAMYFVLSLKHDSLFDIIDPQLSNKGKDEQIKEVALIAEKCLALKGEERPTMKQVAKELEGLLAMEKRHQSSQINSQETQHLLMDYNNCSVVDAASEYYFDMMSLGGGR